MLKNSQYLTILFNFEVSVKNNQAAVGFVIRDENARVLLAGAKKIGDVSITVVECMDIRDGLAYVVPKGWRKIMV